MLDAWNFVSPICCALGFYTSEISRFRVHCSPMKIQVFAPAEKIGYHVAPLHDLLMTAPAKYHQLLVEAQAPELRKLVDECSNHCCQVTSAAQAAELSAVLGLPLATHSNGDIGPTPPFDAPFSEMVPKLLYLVRK